MFPGSPAPLSPRIRLGTVVELLPPAGTAGVWLRECRALRPLHLSGARRLLVSSDLGSLLRRCSQVVVRAGGEPVLLSAAQLIRCRVLEVVLGTPFLPPPAQLRELFPVVARSRGGFALPIGLGSAEEALAVCAAHRLPVVASRIRYASASR